jgi:hypothetical protein
MFSSGSCILSILVSCRSHTHGHLVFQKRHNHRFPKLKKYVFASILILFNRPYYFIHKTIIHFSLIFGILRRMPSHLLRATVLVTQKSRIFIQQWGYLKFWTKIYSAIASKKIEIMVEGSVTIMLLHAPRNIFTPWTYRHVPARITSRSGPPWQNSEGIVGLINLWSPARQAATDHHSTRSSISVLLLITCDVSSQLSTVLYF